MISSIPKNTPVGDLPLAIASMSLGRAWVHDLEGKLDAAGRAGYHGVEMYWEDLVYAAKRFDPLATETSQEAIIEAAHWAKELCNRNELEVLVVQPLMNYEGTLDEVTHAKHLVKLRLMFRVAKILDTDLIQIPSQMLKEGTTGDFDSIVADMKEVAVLGLQQQPPIRFVYEAMAWGAHIDTWEDIWRVVEAVNLPNFGILLDTFQIIGRVWGDPTSPDMKAANADQAMAESLERMRHTPGLVDKIFYIQLSDVERLQEPLSTSHPVWKDDMPPRMQWSRNFRTFPCEDRNCLAPLTETVRTWFHDMGWRGWVSMEVFNKSMESPSPDVPELHAERGTKSWHKLLKELERT
ncbi:hypothetical protein QFC21_000337 [Naganishia friedmannii]|uniref:Uncharacterized protein n=1 Tax=Naganishia friedmannii TaxID=89922 RepID=A0ACC2WCA0_9TREE|nr:hypothetical protein QFC21_000337 [Naganishia friedmannii]